MKKYQKKRRKDAEIKGFCNICFTVPASNMFKDVKNVNMNGNIRELKSLIKKFHIISVVQDVED